MSREYQQRLISRKLVQFTLSVNDYRVLSLLRTGQYTSFEIGEKLKLPDPRSNIRYLRKAGYPISDYCVKNGADCYSKIGHAVTVLRWQS